MIGRAMESWPDDALRRVLDASVGEWRLSWDGCLACHRYDDDRSHWLHGPKAVQLADSFDPALITTRLDLSAFCFWRDHQYRGNHHPMYGGSGRYVRLCTRFGIPRTVRAIKIRALAILERRAVPAQTRPKAADTTNPSGLVFEREHAEAST